METTLDWFGCATFRLRVAEMTIFLDAYIDRAANAAGTGMTADDIDDCDWIIVGHSHFDHLWGAERIMANTEARLIGSYETVRVMEAAGVPADRMICVAGGETVDLGNDVTVDLFPSQHSCVWSQRQMSQAGDVCLGDLGVTWQEQQARMVDLQTFLFTEMPAAAVTHLLSSAAGHSPRGDGGALVALLTTPAGSLLFQDTSGHWTGILGELRPDVAIIAAAGRGNIDGEPIQGSLAEFVAREAELLQPRRMLLCHHDDWLPGFSVATDLPPIRAAVSTLAPSTELIEPGYLAGTQIFADLKPPPVTEIRQFPSGTRRSSGSPGAETTAAGAFASAPAVPVSVERPETTRA